MRQYLTGEALKVVEKLSFSANGYKVAKEKLDRKYGGKRRQIAIQLDEVEKFPPLRQNNAHDVEAFADMLDVVVVNLMEAERYSELGSGTLYTQLQRKLTNEMLVKYHRWIYEKNKIESE